MYQPIAVAQPGQEAVEVSVWPCVQVSMSAALLLDRARAEDDVRWPAVVAQEREEARRTFAARVTVAQAEMLLDPQEPGPPAGRVPLPTAGQGAATDLVSDGDEVDPGEAVALVCELVAGGELMVDEVLDEAVAGTVLAGLLVLEQVRTTSGPGMVAELCRSTVPYLVLAVCLAGADLD